MKYLKKFDTISEFISFKDSSSYIDPNVSTVGYKGKVNFSSGSKSSLNLCDIIYWDGENIGSTPKGTWSSSFGLPLGVVVIPEGYTVDGNARIMAIKPSDANGHPTDELVKLVWDNSKEIINTELNDFNNPLTPLWDDAGNIVLGEGQWLPSSYLDGSQAINDAKAYYHTGSTETQQIISPYRNNYVNPDFYSVGNSPLSDFNGLENTIKLVGLGSQYEAANAAWNYIDDASKLQWYLPSMGELSFMFARLKEIDETILEVGGVSPISIIATDDLSPFETWSSTEKNRSDAYYLFTQLGYITYTTKSIHMPIYPFTMMNISKDIVIPKPEDKPIRTGVQVGDVAYVNNPSSLFKIVLFCSIDKWDDSKGTPIGIVVMSADDTPDGYIRIVALTNTIGSSTNLSWGPTTNISLKDYSLIPIVDNDTMEVSYVSYTEGGNMASDSLTGDIDPITDNKSSYFSDVKNNLIPSPYSGYERNSIYYTDVPGSNALSDFDGYTNTQTLVGLGTGYTAANAAWNYKDDASACQWYLPAMGELGYMFARIKLIDKSYSKLKGRAGILYENVWSSTEASSIYVWGVNENGVCKGLVKSNRCQPLAFAKVKKPKETTFNPSLNNNLVLWESSYLNKDVKNDNVVGKPEFLDVAFWEDDKIKSISLPEYIYSPRGTSLGIVVMAYTYNDNKPRIIDFNLLGYNEWSKQKKNNKNLLNYTNFNAVIADVNGLSNTKNIISFGGDKYPSAYKAYNYNKKGSNIQWYLPAMGEYHMMYMEFINNEFLENTVAKNLLLQHLNIDVDKIMALCNHYSLWSSNEYDKTYAWSIDIKSNGFDLAGLDSHAHNKETVLNYYLPMAMIPTNTKIGYTEVEVAYWNGRVVKTVYASEWDSTLGTPIGVVVVPKGFAPDGNARIIALKPVDKNGNSSNSPINMAWGRLGVDTTLIKNNKVPRVSIQSFQTDSYAGFGRLPMPEKNGGILSWFDLKSYYNGGGAYIPSPYLGNSPNPEYVRGISGYTNVLADFNGFTNTETLVGLGTTYEAANACWKYKDGVSNIQWYLPAMGELGYITPKLSDINRALQKLGGVAIADSDKLWSSNPSDYGTETLQGDNYAFGLEMDYAKVCNDILKNRDFSVRPFAKI